MTDYPFAFLHAAPRPGKPRTRGLTEIRGPYYSPVGKHHLEDLLGTWGEYVDSIKFAGGSFALMPGGELREFIEIAHRHDVLVSTGGFIERVLLHGSDAVDRYLAVCHDLGFDIIEISAGFVTLAADDWLRLIEKVQTAGLRVKPELGIQFGAGGDTPAAELEREGTRDPEWVVRQAERFLEAGAYLIMIESEGITENVREWRTGIVAQLIDRIGTDKVMFEAADPAVFSWYVKHYGAEVNLFVDHSQIIQLEALRTGLWGPQSLWGRVVGYRR